MLFARLEDLSANVEILVFPKLLAGTETLWLPDRIVAVDGYINFKDGTPKVLADQVQEIGEQKELLDFKKKPKRGKNGYKSGGNGEGYQNGIGNSGGYQNNTPPPPKKDATAYDFSPKTLKLTVPKGCDKSILVDLKEIFESNKGKSAVVINIPNNGHGYKEKTVKSKVDINPVLNKKLTELVGKKNIQII